MKYLLAAPARVGIVGITDTTVTVQAVPPSGNPNIANYKAVAGPTKECSIAATASSLQCTIDELMPGATYEVSLSACMPDGVSCGSPILEEVKTKYSGRQLTRLNRPGGRSYLTQLSFA